MGNSFTFGALVKDVKDDIARLNEDSVQLKSNAAEASPAQNKAYTPETSAKPDASGKPRPVAFADAKLIRKSRPIEARRYYRTKLSIDDGGLPSRSVWLLTPHAGYLSGHSDIKNYTIRGNKNVMQFLFDNLKSDFDAFKADFPTLRDADTYVSFERLRNVAEVGRAMDDDSINEKILDDFESAAIELGDRIAQQRSAFTVDQKENN